MWNAIQYRSNRRSGVPGGERQGDREGGIHTPRWFLKWGNAVIFFFLYIIFVTAGRNQIPHDAVAGKTRGRNHSLNSNKQQEQHTRR